MRSSDIDCPGIYIALGSNLGDRKQNLRDGLEELCRDGQVRIIRVSAFHETVAEGGPAGQPPFLNATAEIDTALSPRDLLNRMLRIEENLGRIRPKAGAAHTCDELRNGPRTLDLDLLIYRDLLINQPPHLLVPHPRMWQRQFVLVPLAEIVDVGWLQAFFQKNR